MISPRQLAAVGEAAYLNLDQAALRQRFPGLHISLCSDDDVSPRHQPALSLEHFNLYLIGGNGHCLELTHDFDQATGILVASRADDA